MDLSKAHGRFLSGAIKKLLGNPEQGSVAFIKCLTPDLVKGLIGLDTFEPQDWKVWLVGNNDHGCGRTISADYAVELRETKGDPLLLLVDTENAGAGMDGIYSAALEVDEVQLFKGACSLARREITKVSSSLVRTTAADAVGVAKKYGGLVAVNGWTEFDFLCQVVEDEGNVGAHLHRLGLWCINEETEMVSRADLLESCKFVEVLLGVSSASHSPASRVDRLRLDEESEEFRTGLVNALKSVEGLPKFTALQRLRESKELWVGRLRRRPDSDISGIKLTPWRNNKGNVHRWSGLTILSDTKSVPQLIFERGDEKKSENPIFEIRWTVEPTGLEKDSVEYEVTVNIDLDGNNQRVPPRVVSHSDTGREQKCRFTVDDFDDLEDGALVSATVKVDVVGRQEIEGIETEEFNIRFGKLPPKEQADGAHKKYRTLSEGLVEAENRKQVSSLTAELNKAISIGSNGYVVLREPTGKGKLNSVQVYYPPLISEVERQWVGLKGAIGRWKVTVRDSGDRSEEAEFIPLSGEVNDEWQHTELASRKLARVFQEVGSIGQVYDDTLPNFGEIKEYTRSWSALLKTGNPMLALANTIEVQSLSGNSIGIIVLPSHPLRVAWHAAYDNLVLHTAFETEHKAKEGDTKTSKRKKIKSNDIIREFKCLDGSMFPEFLPNPNGGTYVFGDMLGFHAVGMVPDSDKEPKAAMAILSRTIGEGKVIDVAPTTGTESARVLTDEIAKYLDCHENSRLLYIHALRAGDGLTVSRALGGVHKRFSSSSKNADRGKNAQKSRKVPVFSLDIYPSQQQRGVSGKFITDARAKRRKRSGVIEQDDKWMFESVYLPSGINIPRLRWARKEPSAPKTSAHLAIAFDTFESMVVAAESLVGEETEPHYAFGMISTFERRYSSTPSPIWESKTRLAEEGEKHPSRRSHSEVIKGLQAALKSAVVRHLGKTTGNPVLRTEITSEKEDSLKELHELCDWVITLDRNAGVEYFDSPRDNRAIYDAYVIDCVPEREDLGCLQLITSTSNLEEVQNLLNETLDQMGLIRSRKNAEFLLENLKALSGRLAIRLTGDHPPTSELVALAISRANCRHASSNGDCWVSLSGGFIIPVDDVRDLLPPLNDSSYSASAERPDLIYVSVEQRRGLSFRFIEVKYRRHLRRVRAPEFVNQILSQTSSLRSRWEKHYMSKDVCNAFRSVRRANLARVLRFYADKAHRHGLSSKTHAKFISEINRMIERGADYKFAPNTRGDLGWVFCPEHGNEPELLSTGTIPDQVFLFGPERLPSSGRDDNELPSGEASVNRSIDAENEGETNSNVDDEPQCSTVKTKDVLEVPTETNKPPPSINLGTDVLASSAVDWHLRIKGNPHLLIAGLPGMGKTTCLINLCKQMVAGDVLPIVFSFHQDIDEKLVEAVGDVRFVTFDGLGFNPLQIEDRSKVTAHLDVAGEMRDIFTAIYPELGDLQADMIRQAIKKSFEEIGWVNQHTVDGDPPFKRFVDILRAKKVTDSSLKTLLTRLGELDDYGFFTTSKAEHGNLWEGKKPVVVQIHTTQNENLQRAFSYLVFYGLYKDMFRRGLQNRITHSLVFDEAHRAAKLKLIPTMAKECRKYGISMVLASQEATDFDSSVFSAIANYLVLRSTAKDARFLVKNVSDSRQEKPLIDQIKRMDRFKALYFREGKNRPSHIKLAL